MSEVPESIWATPDVNHKNGKPDWTQGNWDQDKSWAGHRAVEYIRADIADARVRTAVARLAGWQNVPEKW